MNQEAKQWVFSELGNRVRVHRETRGWTQADLGERIQASTSVVARIECGQRPPTLDTLLDLADLFGVDAGRLIAGRRQGRPRAEVAGDDDDKAEIT